MLVHLTGPMPCFVYMICVPAVPLLVGREGNGAGAVENGKNGGRAGRAGGRGRRCVLPRPACLATPPVTM
jgi:hypothetical protein